MSFSTVMITQVVQSENMPSLQVVGVVIALCHIITLLATIARLVFKKLSSTFWYDDAFLLAAAVCDLPLLMEAISFGLGNGSTSILLTKLSVMVHFLIAWNSRTSLVMATARILDSHDDYALRYWGLVAVLEGAGLAHGLAATILCGLRTDGGSAALYSCQPPVVVIESVMYGYFLVDIALIRFNLEIFAGYFDMALFRVSRQYKSAFLVVMASLLNSVASTICSVNFLGEMDDQHLMYLLEGAAVFSIATANFAGCSGITGLSEYKIADQDSNSDDV